MIYDLGGGVGRLRDRHKPSLGMGLHSLVATPVCKGLVGAAEEEGSRNTHTHHPPR